MKQPGNLLAKLIPARAFLILKMLALLLVFNFLLRLIFLLYNLNSAAESSVTDITWAFFAGIRFDLAITVMLNALFFLLMLMPVRRKWEQFIHSFSIPFIAVLNIAVFLVNAIDVIYYSTASKRLTHELFSTGAELMSFSFSSLLPYSWLMIILAAISWLLYRRLRKLSARYLSAGQESGESKLAAWIMLPVACILMALCARGGVQNRPLRPADAFLTSDAFSGNLGLNTAYAVLSSIDIGIDKPVSYMSDQEAVSLVRPLYQNDFDSEYLSDEYPLLRQTFFREGEKRANVILLVVESFNANKTGCITGNEAESLTPFFDSLARHGSLFTNFISNGSRSIQSLPAIFNSLPEIFERPTIGSSYETNHINGMGHMLRERGYYNTFYCGGPNGTMGFDTYSRISGIENYFGWNEFPEKETNNVSDFGIHDGPFLNWMADEQLQFREPFFSVWYSISNHFPFDTPLDCPKSISEKWSGPDMTLAYTDYVLQKYFEKIRHADWYENTIFLITGDHCFYGPEDSPRAMPQNFHVPLLILGPGTEPYRDDQLASHLDILPTLIDLLKLKTTHASAGTSLLQPDRKSVTMNRLMELMTLGLDSVAWSSVLPDQNPQVCVYGNGIWDYKQPVEFQKDLHPDYQLYLKALYQVFHNTRVRNKIHPPLVRTMNI